MAEYCKLTGETLDDYLEVQMLTNERVYAKVAIMGNTVSRPSKEWVQENKNNFLAIVEYDRGQEEAPFIFGFIPKSNITSIDYNITEQLLNVVSDLVDQLSVAKVNTSIGAQPFLPDTIKVLKELQNTIVTINNKIL